MTKNAISGVVLLRSGSPRFGRAQVADQTGCRPDDRAGDAFGAGDDHELLTAQRLGSSAGRSMVENLTLAFSASESCTICLHLVEAGVELGSR